MSDTKMSDTNSPPRLRQAYRLLQLRQEYRALKERYCAMEERVIAAISQRDKALAFLQVYRNEALRGHPPYILDHELDMLLKECGK